MCRNIRVLHHFEPPTTPEEIRAAALQYVRKVSGLTKPAKADGAEIARAVDAVARATARLLERLPERGAPRTREGERARAKARWTSREARIVSGAKRDTEKRASTATARRASTAESSSPARAARERPAR
ncbi:MAG: DUF2277 domain-containing protein [Labilithrix sp.]|nr:DUF2277 domain-containing protein [Labilithrix sp.]